MKRDMISNRIFPLSLLIGLTLFLFILFLPLPYSFTFLFASYSPLLFLLVFALYGLTFRIKGSLGWILGLSLTAILFALALSYMWASGYSDNKIIGGLLPYRDAYHYYNGAGLILNGGLLTENTVQAAGRPLFPGFLSSLLLITGRNLQISTAILVALLGFVTFLSAQKIYEFFGALVASLYISFFFLYAQSQIGFLHTELIGLILGGLGFVLILETIEEKALLNFVYAMFILMIAVSARAGAFFVFPMLAIWAGYTFVNNEKFSWRSFTISFISIIVSYLIVNNLYTRFVVDAGNPTFGNFAYTLYGQVLGGTGWNRAIRDLGTRDPAIIMDAALKLFQAHPFSFFIGTAKAYRDFFVPNENGILNFSGSKIKWLDIALWVTSILLLIRGLFYSFKNRKKPVYSLLLASFIGIFFSIPFLPPIDGGNRFYASTMPFFFALIAVGFPSQIKDSKTPASSDKRKGIVLLSGLLAVMILVMPVLIIKFTSPVEILPMSCPSDQEAYAFHLNPDSYIDIISSEKEYCGKVPLICYDDFLKNATERNNNLFFQALLKEIELGSGSIRILTTKNMLSKKSFYYFVGDARSLEISSNTKLIRGCATSISIKGYPSIYRIESIVSP